MRNLLYIGNKLNHRQSTMTSIDVLGTMLEAGGYKVFYASSKQNKIWRFMDMLWTVYKLRKKIDYVLIDTYSTLNFYYAFGVSQLCRVLKLKYIPILHGGNLPNRLEQNPKFCHRIFSYAYKNVAPSNYIKAEFEKHGYYNVICIPNSIQIKKYSFQIKSFEYIKILWVRSFSKIYNPLLAIYLLKTLQDKGLSATLCMVGPDKDGSLQEAKKLSKALQVEVVFTGKLSKKEWIDLSVDYNIFINTTNFDNMPVSVIEAMALGLPVISTNVGGMPFLIENKVNGVLVKPNSEKEFVQAIKNIIAKPDYVSLLANNARKTAEQFDWDIVKKKWFALLQ